MWLTFVGGPYKWFARTPDGEYAFSDAQGLYEWHHRDPTHFGLLTRTQYTGGDRQCSSNGALWTSSGTPRHSLAHVLGKAEALRQFFQSSN